MVAARRLWMAVARASVPLVALALWSASSGCVVEETRDDVLRKAWRCQDDTDCTEGWACRAFALDPDGQGYCVKPCTSDDDCRFGDVCGNEGFCVEPCDLTAPSCRDPKYHCQRWNMTPGEQGGICQPASPCDSSLDCGSDYDQCLSSLVVSVTGNASLESDQSACMQSCVNKVCEGSSMCLPDALDLVGLPSSFAPGVCVPSCGEGNACPNGFRCLMDALQEINPTGEYDALTTKFCVPGLSGVGLPCHRDEDCLTGRCVAQPGRTLPSGDPLLTCALPCDEQSQCASSREMCMGTEYQGQSMGFCFQAFKPCPRGDECTPPQRCMDLQQIGAGKLCLDPCDGWRDASHCGAQLTCIADATGSQFGCFPGWPGYPCASDDQCHQELGEETLCLGLPADPSKTICTKSCTTNADCDFGDLLQTPGYFCLDGVCRLMGLPCDVPGLPYECDAGMQCAEFFGSGQSSYRFCTIPCAGPRMDEPADPACPDHFTCARLLQEAGPPPIIEAFCVQGLPGMMPCSRDAECWDAFGDGSEFCMAPVEGQAPEETGLCSVPCASDADCQSVWSSDSVPVFCLPGVPSPESGRPGACYGNPSFDTLLGPTPRYQGTFCGPAYGDPPCAPNHECVTPFPGDLIALSDVPGQPFCALECSSPSDCPQEPTPHDCVEEPGVGSQPSYCRPAHDPNGRGFWAPCRDHRQCEWGLCYQPDLTAPGNCTRACTATGNECDVLPDARCNVTPPHVCKPRNIQGS